MVQVGGIHRDGFNICNASHGAHFAHGLYEQLCISFRPGRLVLQSRIDGLELE
ncbi:hypothetical protein OAK87_02365 [bacterium]|nr:hypothetical protein [bacterium]